MHDDDIPECSSPPCFLHEVDPAYSGLDAPKAEIPLTITETSTPEGYLTCSGIWLKSSIAGHPFIAEEFWRANQHRVAEQYLPGSRVLLASVEKVPVAFAATRGNELAAFFILPSRWRKGIGQKLMHHLFAEHRELNLAVYAKNRPALMFYEHMGFVPVGQRICPHTHEREILMHWESAPIPTEHQ